MAGNGKPKVEHRNALERGKYYLVEEKESNRVYYSQNKIDAIYKHVEYRYGKAKYRESFRLPEGKELINMEE